MYEAYRIKRHVLHRLRAVVARTRTHHAAAVEFRSRRLLCSSFWALRWWATRVRSHRARRRAHLQRSAMRFWHRVSFRRASCREALTSMTEQRVAERRRRAWYLWRRLYLHRRRMEELALAAARHYRIRLARKTMRHWRRWRRRMRRMDAAAEATRRMCAANRARSALRVWRTALAACVRARARYWSAVMFHQRHLLVSCMDQWRDHTSWSKTLRVRGSLCRCVAVLLTSATGWTPHPGRCPHRASTQQNAVSAAHMACVAAVHGHGCCRVRMEGAACRQPRSSGAAEASSVGVAGLDCGAAAGTAA